MTARVILSVVGSDRPGLTQALADAVMAAGGNWLESHLSRLGGTYVGSVLVALDPAAPPTAPRARAQRLYYPTAVAEPRMGGAFEVVPGRRGAGFDVLEAIRGEDGYSPLCEVFTYVPADPQIPARDARDIDPMTVKPDARERFVYFPQLEGGPT